MQKTIGILVMGQSPRPEINDQFHHLLADVKIIQRGCLDGLSQADITRLAPQREESTLFTRLPDGTGIQLSKAAVIRHGEKQLDALEREGSALTVVLCTGDFPIWRDRKVLMPSDMLRHFTMALHPKGHIAILSPLPSQLNTAQTRWQSLGYQTTNLSLSPNATEQEAVRAGERLAASAAAFIVFDCVSYRQTTKRLVCETAKKPGILALSCIARMAAELID